MYNLMFFKFYLFDFIHYNMQRFTLNWLICQLATSWKQYDFFYVVSCDNLVQAFTQSTNYKDLFNIGQSIKGLDKL